ncbi:MAG TPA: hypothetical protein VJ862_11165 [Rhodanobacteraceae bacterium]|nr:hypothetical protein [Rhodanobacteraceae bacterium]
MKRSVIWIPCILAVALGGCFNLGTKPSEIAPAYVPATAYQGYDCEHLAIELADLSRRDNELTSAQQQRRESNKVQAFWVGFGNGDGVAANELAYIKGAVLAVQKEEALKRCGSNSIYTPGYVPTNAIPQSSSH